ncbi:MAG: aminoacyl-tRNA hydrolase [Phycisphaerae bacterium]|nr:aminoacyl-tRNA hydrolase [Phycisphaerae bacterium]
MKLIVGLGNPGLEYDRTRHNVGFESLDRLARRTVDASNSIAKSRFSGVVLEGEIRSKDGDEKVLLLKPLTYMNRSGQSVAEAVRFYKLDPSKDLLVLVDDIALPCGVIRLRPDGSAGGHNGLADIEEKLGTSKYPRCRIGIDAPGQVPQKDYVLGRFRPDQQPLIENGLEQAVQASQCWGASDLQTAMNRFNTTTKAGGGNASLPRD